MDLENNEDRKKAPSLNLSEIENRSASFLADWGEFAIDSLLKDGPIRDIPIFGTALKAIQGVKAIRDHFFMQKLSAFIQSARTLDPEKIQQFRDKMKTDSEFANRTATHLTVVLDRLDEKDKAILFARLFSAYLNNNIEQLQMKRLAAALDRALLDDIIGLKHFIKDKRTLSLDNFYGLEGVGLASVYHSITRPLEETDVHGQTGDLHFVISPTAVRLVELAF